MDIDEKLNGFLFIFSAVVFLYAFFTMKHYVNEFGEHVSSIPVTVIICPFICFMCMLKFIKLYQPIATRSDKRIIIKKIITVITDKYYEGVDLNKEWRDRKKYKY